MASSDDEAENLPEFVSSYYFVDGYEEPISFHVLPIKWSVGDSIGGGRKQIYVHGTADDGLQKIYKPVTAWKFDLSGVKPDISVLCKENNWIKLQKPRKSYENIIRTILITVNCLHLVKKNPELTGQSLWDKLSRTFSNYEERPSQNDLIDHMQLIEEAVKRDDSLAKSEFLMAFLKEKPQKKKIADEDAVAKGKLDFIVDDDTIDDPMKDGSDDEDDGLEGDDLYDSVCAICDNGGEILSCEGSCMRSFHATPEDAAEAESACTSLGLSRREVEAIQNFKCKNCQHMRHQCYACGLLGSSDKSSNAEVFQCVNATCGYFYHPRCVAKLLHRENEVAAKELQEKIVAGESFTCPLHICFACKQIENKTDHDLQMAVCRRCPKGYHRKCLPRKIAFEENEEQGIKQRAWDGLLVDRILIYCLKHEILDELGTPERNHIKFPGVEGKKVKRVVACKEKVLVKKKKVSVEASQESADFSAKKIEKSTIAVKEGHLDEKNDQRSMRLDSKKPKGINAARTLSASKKSSFTKPDASPRAEEGKNNWGEQLFALVQSQQTGTAKGGKPDRVDTIESTKRVQPATVKSEPELDLESEKRILDLMKEAESSITLDAIFEKHNKLASTHAHSQKVVVDRTITLGKVEGSVEAVRAALKKLDEGGSVEDAKAICDPKVLNQIVKWKNKLRVYLSPFLYGMRYTSFGRHFTKADKLSEIVNTIHWYIESGDTIVDFCCGANDFSWFMKEKLEQAGKQCSYRNFDLFRPKNDFMFEKRDWMSVKPSELPPGSQLIMGLNPPFGVKAALANKFIDKALQFKPKLVILIVPPETERLDKKRNPYDLIWEDSEILSGKSFYLPGSVDVNDKQVDDWNVVTPVLYLWSRRDWTAKHKEIAEIRGHIRANKKELDRKPVHKIPREELAQDDVDMEIDDDSAKISRRIEPEEPAKETKNLEEAATPNIHDIEKHVNHNMEHSIFDKDSRNKPNSIMITEERREIDVPPEYEQKPNQPSPSEYHPGGSSQAHSPLNAGHGRSSIEEYSRNQSSLADMDNQDPMSFMADGYSPINRASPSDVGVRDTIHGNFRHRYSPMRYGREYQDDITRRYTMESDPNLGNTDYALRSSNGWGPSYMNNTKSYGYGRPFHRNESDTRFRPSSTYLPEPSYNRMSTMSAMDRYAPRLDEMNPMRMRNVGAEIPGPPRSGMYDPRVPGPGFGGDRVGFAPGPMHPYPHQGSSGGWLND